MNSTHHSVRDGIAYRYAIQGLQVAMRGADGSFAAWDMDHWMKVQQARTKGIGCKPLKNGLQHPLLGKKILDTTTNKVYVVEKVIRNWWFGAFLSAVLKGDGTDSHGVRYIENISCVLPATLAAIGEFKATFKVMD
jgi:hypothetical protein